MSTITLWLGKQCSVGSSWSRQNRCLSGHSVWAATVSGGEKCQQQDLRCFGEQQPSSVLDEWLWHTLLERMESHDYEHYRNLTLMFFFEKLLEKGGEESRLFRWKIWGWNLNQKRGCEEKYAGTNFILSRWSKCSVQGLKCSQQFIQAFRSR